MKHLLIILSILLLSSPVIGDNHKGETLYKWRTSSGIKWKDFGDKDTHPMYVGEVENGIPNGQGVFTYPDGRKYVGEFRKGIQRGQGTNTFINGWNGIGEWIDVEPWNIKVFDKKGNLKMKWKNGKVQYF